MWVFETIVRDHCPHEHWKDSKVYLIDDKVVKHYQLDSPTIRAYHALQTKFANKLTSDHQSSVQIRRTVFQGAVFSNMTLSILPLPQDIIHTEDINGTEQVFSTPFYIPGSTFQEWKNQDSQDNWDEFPAEFIYDFVSEALERIGVPSRFAWDMHTSNIKVQFDVKTQTIRVTITDLASSISALVDKIMGDDSPTNRHKVA